LRRFQDGLRASHEGPPARQTVLGHSYGSLVVGTAAATPGLAADSVVFVGSPGVGVDSASRLHVPGGEVWASTSRTDVIQYAALSPQALLDKVTAPVPWLAFARPGQDLWFGHNPAGPEFGARVFAAQSDAGHLGYWDHGRPALDTLAAITLGVATRP
jgi:pimeloyl-ACP methyl ester carboxylesterase